LFFFKNFGLDLKHSARRAYALHDVDKGALILEEGACAAFLGINAVWINAYGWPAYRGGPMFWREIIGHYTVVAGLQKHGFAAASSLLASIRTLS
jgi:hypothetical protein